MGPPRLCVISTQEMKFVRKPWNEFIARKNAQERTSYGDFYLFIVPVKQGLGFRGDEPSAFWCRAIFCVTTLGWVDEVHCVKQKTKIINILFCFSIKKICLQYTASCCKYIGGLICWCKDLSHEITSHIIIQLGRKIVSFFINFIKMKVALLVWICTLV